MVQEKNKENYYIFGFENALTKNDKIENKDKRLIKYFRIAGFIWK